MPRLNHFRIKIETGEQGTGTPPRCNFNGHLLEIEKLSGGTAPGESFEGEFAPRSFVHTFTLVGPDEGSWRIKKCQVTYDCEDVGVYSVTFGEMTLDETNQANIWKDKPILFFEV